MTITGGAAQNNNDNGGAVTLAGGAPNGTGAKGVINLNGRLASGASDQLLSAPANGAAIPVTTSGTVPIAVAGAGETNTLAIPTFAGQWLTVSCDTLGGGGDRTVTVAADIDASGNDKFQFTAAGQYVRLDAMQVGGALVWRVFNGGATLS